MLSLKIDNQFIALPDSTEISIEASNPIFSDAGAKTYLFEIPVESLRYIIGNADEIYGESLYDVLEGKRAEIYIDGVQFFSGVVNLEDEISIEDGKIAVSIASGNLEFAQMIEGMNCRDVELKDDIEIGWVYDSARVKFKTSEFVRNYAAATGQTLAYEEHEMEFFFPENYVAVSDANIHKTYKDGAPFCNIRRAYSIENAAAAENYIKSHEDEKKPRINLKSTGGKESILSLEYNSMRSAPCFYVLYFLDRLFRKLNLSVKRNDLLDIEDASRLAFVNTSCGYSRIGDKEEVLIQRKTSSQPGLGLTYDCFRYGDYDVFEVETLRLVRQKAIATSDNFPDVPVSDVVDAIQNLFNVKIVSTDNEVSIISVQDTLKDSEFSEVNTNVYDVSKRENRTKGFSLSYSANEEDTNYVFSDYKDVKSIDQYGEVLKEISANNPTVYIDSRNGNAYAIKVSEEALENGIEKELNPILFEVGGYAPALYGDCSDERYTENVKLDFLPVINIDTEGESNIDKVANAANIAGVDSSLENTFALAVEVDEDPVYTLMTMQTPKLEFVEVGSRWAKKIEAVATFNLSYFDYNPEEKIESDFMLGIMRGPGSDSEPETFEQNFDGEGNYRVAYTAANYAFTSDSIDNCNRYFDYNGTAEGVGPDELKGRFSLKLRAGKYDKDGNPIKDADGKPIVIQDKERAERGLYDKFWKEYAYFTVNKKIIHLTCGMEISDIVNLDWTKRYRIGEWAGFIANYSFNVNKNGMSEVELEMYYL